MITPIELARLTSYSQPITWLGVGLLYRILILLLHSQHCILVITTLTQSCLPRIVDAALGRNQDLTRPCLHLDTCRIAMCQTLGTRRRMNRNTRTAVTVYLIVRSERPFRKCACHRSSKQWRTRAEYHVRG